MVAIALLLAACLGSLGPGRPASGQAPPASCPDPVAMLVSVQGAVQVRRVGQTTWAPARLGEALCVGDAVRVDARSRAGVAMASGAVLRLDQNTTITFAPPTTRATSWIQIFIGAVHFVSRAARTLNVLTPFVNGAVEGTEFWIEVGPDEATLTVLEGRVAATNPAGSVAVSGGQAIVARAGQPPVIRPLPIHPTDAVRWALYYPPVLDERPADFPDQAGEPWRAAVRRSIEAAEQGDLERAFAELMATPAPVTDPRFLVHRAGLLLAVGRADEAAADIEAALRIAPDNGAALALRAVILLAQGAADEALALAREAVRRDDRSASAWLALAYAQQATFDLAGARASLEAALARRPDSALVRAHLAEIWFALGEPGRAEAEAAEAVRLNPFLARTQTVLGFTRLGETRTGAAREAFERAIERDSADPLPRLGLGLALIREGDLLGGRRQLEIAVSLDPGQSLSRSYLGKAYFEERSPPLDAEQFRLAKELDPRDPTPWLYDALRKQSENRPVEALVDFQRSIALNDYRAVARSRLLLDEDLATRGASLGRLHDELGFQGVALAEGWRSLRTDPADHSAHRLLADAYRSLPRHELARVSELLQSQLLQPLNVAPVQPQLGEAELFILEGAGPAEPSPTEFHPLFLRDRLALLLSGLAGEQGTFGDEVVISGIKGPFSFSVGQFHYETDGFRKNHDLEQDVYNVFGQLRLTPRTSLQAEVRVTATERGDRAVRFLPDDFLPNERHELDTWSARLGLHHQFRPGSDLLASFVYRDTEERLRDTNPVVDLDRRTDESGFLAEVQHLFRLGPVRLIGGAGHLEGDHERTTSVRFVALPFPPTTSVAEADLRNTNVYLYSLLTYPRTVTWTLGVSGERLEDIPAERTRVNPKLGVAWDVTPRTTLRAAVFRVLSRPQIVEQTIEPTQVAGFNQFFGSQFGEQNFPGTSAWRYGLAVDHQFSSTLFGGAEVSRRDLDVRGTVTTPDGTSRVEEDWEESLGRVYLYWAPHPWIAARADYQFERFDRDGVLGEGTGIREADTHRVGLGVTLFHPSRLSLGIKTTYIDQDGKFVRRVFQRGDFTRGSDRFWVTDLALRYRFPKRRGFLTLGVKNLFDERFHFQDTDPLNPTVEPERAFFARLTLAF